MALAILDGTQTATTLSTILSSGQHITAHTVVSLGTQAITDMRSAVSGSVVSVSNLPSTQTIAGTVTANVFGKDATNPTVNAQIPVISYDEAITGAGVSYVVPVQISNNDGTIGSNNPLPISGTVTANVSSQDIYQSTSPTAGSSFLRSALYYENLIGGTGEFVRVNDDADGGLPVRTISGQLLGISGTVTAMAGTNFSQEIYQGILTYSGNEGGDGVSPLQVNIGSIYGAFPAGTNRIGVVTIGAGTVTIGAGTAQIGSVTASISNSVTIASFTTSVTARLINPAGTAVTYAEVGTAGNPSIDVLSVQGVTAGTPLNVYPMQGTTVSNTNFTSTTASTSLVSAVTGREVLTVFNEGAGNLHISPGATATTISYQVRLSAGDYWECPQGQLSLAHTAVFATAGTARVTEVS